jgi:hypothetical protein
MVMALPVSGSTVLVHSAPMRSYLRQMIIDLRGPAVGRRTRILIATAIKDFDQVCNSNRPVIADHAWSEHVARDVYDAIAPLLHETVRANRPPRRQVERRVKPSAG